MGPLDPMIVRLDYEERLRRAEADRLAAQVICQTERRASHPLTALLVTIFTTLQAR